MPLKVGKLWGRAGRTRPGSGGVRLSGLGWRAGREVSLGRSKRPRAICRALCGSESGRQVILEGEEVQRRIASRAEDGKFYP